VPRGHDRRAASTAPLRAGSPGRACGCGREDEGIGFGVWGAFGVCCWRRGRGLGRQRREVNGSSGASRGVEARTQTLPRVRARCIPGARVRWPRSFFTSPMKRGASRRARGHCESSTQSFCRRPGDVRGGLACVPALRAAAVPGPWNEGPGCARLCPLARAGPARRPPSGCLT